MAQAVEILRVVVASPSDVTAEREIVPRVAEELNRSIAADRGLRLEIIEWETDTHPGFHAAGPQGLIDPILRIEDCDLVIGIFWKRFGTPESDGQTGTEHEIRLAYEGWKKNGRPQVMVYFSQKPYLAESEEEADQLRQVLKFRRLFPKEGLWFRYKGPSAFEGLLRQHLTNYLRNRYPVPEPEPQPVAPVAAGYFTVQIKLIAEYTRLFTGRLDAQAALQQFLARNTRGYFLVRAGPGQGKTALSCHLVKNNTYVHHFVDRTGGRADARLILRSLLSQLFALDGKAVNLPESVSELTKLFEETLAEAASKRDRLTILIDGLDELPPAEESPPYLTTEALPDRVFFVVTSRPGDHLERLTQQLFALPRQTYELGALLPAEMRSIVTSVVPDITPADVDRIVEASQGNPLYLRAVLRESSARPQFNLMDLPSGIEGFFRDATASLKVGNAVLSDVLGLLSASRKPLSVAEMSRIAARQQREIVEQGINPVRQFLLEIEGGFTFYHARFHEFVTRTILYEDEIRECHRKIAVWLQSPGLRLSDDGLKSLAWHLFESGSQDELIQTVNEVFLTEKVRRLGYAVLEDVELLTRCLLAKRDPKLIGRCVELVEVLRRTVGGDIVPAIGNTVQPYRAGPPSFRARLIEPRVPGMPGADVYVGVLPKAETPADFFEVVRVQNRLAVAIGDAPAIGLKSTFVARFIANLFREFASEPGRHDQGEIIARIDTTIGDYEYFQSVTMQCVEIDPREGTLRMANAGHPFPVHYSARRKKCDVLPISGSLLHGPVEGGERDEYTIEIGPGDSFVLLTDGLTESHILSETSYGYRFMEIIVQRACDGARAIGQAILDGWKAHSREEDAVDDVTVMVISL